MTATSQWWKWSEERRCMYLWGRWVVKTLLSGPCLCIHVLQSIHQPLFLLKRVEGTAALSSGDWVLSPEELASKFTPRTKAIVINTPNNPLGKVRHLPASIRYTIQYTSIQYESGMHRHNVCCPHAKPLSPALFFQIKAKSFDVRELQHAAYPLCNAETHLLAQKSKILRCFIWLERTFGPWMQDEVEILSVWLIMSLISLSTSSPKVLFTFTEEFCSRPGGNLDSKQCQCWCSVISFSQLASKEKVTLNSRADSLKRRHSFQRYNVLVHQRTLCPWQVYKTEELQVIADLCIKHNVLCFSDEVYEWLTYDGAKHVKIGETPPEFNRMHTKYKAALRTYLVY